MIFSQNFDKRNIILAARDASDGLLFSEAGRTHGSMHPKDYRTVMNRKVHEKTLKHHFFNELKKLFATDFWHQG